MMPSWPFIFQDILLVFELQYDSYHDMFGYLLIILGGIYGYFIYK